MTRALPTRSTVLARAAVLTAAAAVAVVLAATAADARAYRIDSTGSGSGTHDGASIAAAGTATGSPFDGTFTATVVPDDGTLPTPGECEPGTATHRLEGARGRYLDVTATGNVCGHWLQPPTYMLTMSFTGRYVVTDSSQRRLLRTDGFYELRLGDNGYVSTLSIDT
jgi:hypothetical protein